MPAYATPEPITVAVDLAAAVVNVVASDRADTVVTVSPSDPSRSGDVRSADETRVDLLDGTLTVQTSGRWRHLTKSAVEVTIEVPTGSTLQGTALGPLFTEGSLAACSFTSRSGDIRIDVAGQLDLRASAGSVVVGHALGSTSIVAAAGGVRIRELDGDTVLKVPNGSTEIGRTTASLKVNGAHGSIAIGRSLGETEVRCASGSIRVEEATAGRLQLETSYGSIDVGVPEGTAAWLDATSQHGALRHLLQDAVGPDEGDLTVEVHASTSYGDVVVRRPHS
ncbi:DUF4097 family beta strand repeat-containing protein [Cellulomonas sp. P22]|uniref:DUF4097 family beta strand repeat-containing protein n=1 Tax=Cellulomonas sp. P22 TaxID=3373189 RepID=UPI003797B287